ncbi:hypothetical protein MNBD_ALPHA11-1183 [hydrothermal vent metagenome]|uniref:Uncharacterized protein n=1 Tax=hydrothermal vent metagenome TaxID=652676 RepID=A0A3B0TQC0_9ZZZZ
MLRHRYGFRLPIVLFVLGISSRPEIGRNAFSYWYERQLLFPSKKTIPRKPGFVNLKAGSVNNNEQACLFCQEIFKIRCKV